MNTDKKMSFVFGGGTVSMISVNGNCIVDHDVYLFIDRDGVINKSNKTEDDITQDHVLMPDEFIFRPGVLRALKMFKDAGFRCFVLTTQNCVPMGLITRDELDDIHRRMSEVIECNGGHIEDIEVVFTENDSDTNIYGKAISKYLGIRALMARHNIPYDAVCWSIGDAPWEIMAGNILNHRTIQILVKKWSGNCGADYKMDSLLEAARFIIEKGEDPIVAATGSIRESGPQTLTSNGDHSHFSDVVLSGEARFDEKPIDSCIADLVASLVKGGIYTESSCCGHGEAPGHIELQDGRVLYIHER